MKRKVLDSIVTEEEFAEVLGGRASDFLKLLNLLQLRDPSDWVKRHYGQLVTASHELESLLDDFGARNNKSFGYVTELMASLRGLSGVAVTLKHLMGRFPRYNVRLESGLAGSFFAETEQTVHFLNQSILALITALREELSALGVPGETRALSDRAVPDEPLRRLLPHNIDEADAVDEEKKIAEVVTTYLSMADDLARLTEGLNGGLEGLRDFVLQHLDEERCRSIEGAVHSLQSRYDTYVGATPTEAKFPDLRRLRGHVSMSLHLLKMCTELIHFYVRHENDIRNVSVKSRISALVDKTTVLDRAVNYAATSASRIFLQGKELATDLLGHFVSVDQLTLSLAEGSTLHARPISLIVKIVNRHGTHVEMEVGGDVCNASSIMEMIMMVGSNPGVHEIVFHGDARALADIKLLFDHGMGDAGVGSFPDSLDYLR